MQPYLQIVIAISPDSFSLFYQFNRVVSKNNFYIVNEATENRVKVGEHKGKFGLAALSS